MDIQHKHSGHIIVIEGIPFAANEAGMWNLTEIHRELSLPDNRKPAQWRDKAARRFLTMQNLHSQRVGKTQHTFATKRATIEYAGWVSEEFKDLVYDAFEAILEDAVAAAVVAEKMRELGHTHSATLLERMNRDRADALQALKKLPHMNSKEGLKAALNRGNVTPEMYKSLMRNAR